jgi:hypothetical protein
MFFLFGRSMFSCFSMRLAVAFIAYFLWCSACNLKQCAQFVTDEWITCFRIDCFGWWFGWLVGRLNPLKFEHEMSPHLLNTDEMKFNWWCSERMPLEPCRDANVVAGIPWRDWWKWWVEAQGFQMGGNRTAHGAALCSAVKPVHALCSPRCLPMMDVLSIYMPSTMMMGECLCLSLRAGSALIYMQPSFSWLHSCSQN